MQLTKDTLFLALTRPALKWGVPIEALALNLGLTFVAGYELQAPTWWRSPIMFWLMGIPIHFGLRLLTGWDYHWFRSLKLEATTVVFAALESLPMGLPRHPREVPSSV